MGEFRFCVRFALAVLAIWRLTHLLAAEDGPGDILVKLRARLGRSFAGKLTDCFYCLSLWIAAPAVLYVSGRRPDWPLVWLALSAGACLLERLGANPVVMQPISNFDEGDSNHVLRTETSGVAEPIEIHAAPQHANHP
ncbi:MAG: hypothetical protein JO099_09020 [Acidobacteriia bacterium]|nr:hypothetical protein [Terriglobia bacterium]